MNRPFAYIAFNRICRGQFFRQQSQANNTKVSIFIWRWWYLCLASLVGGVTVAVFFVTVFFAAVVFVAVCFFISEMLTGEVSSALLISFRPLFDGFFGAAVWSGSLWFKIDELEVANDIADINHEMEGSGVDASSSWQTFMSSSLSKLIHRCSALEISAFNATPCAIYVGFGLCSNKQSKKN